MPPENPYRVLGPRIPSMLGRAELVARIESRLDQQEPEHVSVVGPAMFGKSVLRYASGTGLQGRTIRRVTRHVSRPSALLLEHLQSVGNFGQHQDDDVDKPFAVSICMASITLCHSLSRDSQD